MTTLTNYQNLLNQIAQLRATLIDQLSSQLVQNPQLADVIQQQVDAWYEAAIQQIQTSPSPPDFGLAELAGIGPNAATNMGVAQFKPQVIPYDDTVTSERLIALGDLYYLYKMERIGVFRVVLKLQELFKAGSVRLSDGQGAFGLYQFDRRQVLRYTRNDRMQAYRRAFGYTQATPSPGAVPNNDFHRLLVHFMTEVAQYYRDKRISEVIRPQSDRATFGSVAVVRRAGLDLRNNLKHASYGHVNILRVEMLQLLEEAFKVLDSPDIEKLFGADNAWDVVEEVMRIHLKRPQIRASQHSRMADSGRKVMIWLAQPNILNESRIEFEAEINEIADEAEEWLTSAESLGVIRPRTYRAGPDGRARPVGNRELEWAVN